MGAERVAVDAAAGRVLAEDVTSAVDLPSFDYSAMDGYAVAAPESPATRRGASTSKGRVAPARCPRRW